MYVKTSDPDAQSLSAIYWRLKKMLEGESRSAKWRRREMQEKNQDVGEWDDGEGRLENITAGSLFYCLSVLNSLPSHYIYPKPCHDRIVSA